MLNSQIAPTFLTFQDATGRSFRRRRCRRRKTGFGLGEHRPISREDLAWLKYLARAWVRPKRRGKAGSPASRRGLSNNDVAVLDALLSFADKKTGLCIPGDDKVAGRCGLDRDTVRASRNRLEGLRLLTWQRRYRVNDAVEGGYCRTTNSYRFAARRAVNHAPVVRVHPGSYAAKRAAEKAAAASASSMVRQAVGLVSSTGDPGGGVSLFELDGLTPEEVALHLQCVHATKRNFGA